MSYSRVCLSALKPSSSPPLIINYLVFDTQKKAKRCRTKRKSFGLCPRRACYGVLRFVMENGVKGCEVIVSGRLRAQRAKSMKFKDGYMISSGQPVKEYIDSGRVYLVLRSRLCLTGILRERWGQLHHNMLTGIVTRSREQTRAILSAMRCGLSEV
nr:40s ribosomal protein s3-2 [Quercus suber]